jgi:hypothetical protein
MSNIKERKRGRSEKGKRGKREEKGDALQILRILFD